MSSLHFEFLENRKQIFSEVGNTVECHFFTQGPSVALAFFTFFYARFNTRQVSWNLSTDISGS
jgi:hypothetical protein